MLVNPFWFGVLMTIIVEIVIAFVAAFIAANRQTDEDLEEERRTRKVIEQAISTGKVTVISVPKEEDNDDEDY